MRRRAVILFGILGVVVLIGAYGFVVIRRGFSAVDQPSAVPKIEATLSGVFVRAHTFAFISPAMTDKYKIPNPCTSCHTEKATGWAADAMRQWPGKSPWRVD